MLTLEPFSEDQGRSVVHREDPTNQLPYALRVYSPVDSHTCQTPWSVFQGGSNGSPQAGALSTQMRGAPWRVLQTTIKAAASPRAPFHLYLAVLVRYRSRPYLALGGIYRPIGAAFPNNPTRRQRLRGATGSNAAGLSPSLAPLSRNLGPRVIRLTWGRVEDFGSSSLRTGATGDITRLEFTTACRGAPGALSSDFGQRRAVTRETSFRPISSRGWGRRFVTPRQACPRPEGLGRNLRSKTSMVHGILQFTPSIAFRSFFIDHERDIRCEVVLDFTLQHYFRTNTVSGWRRTV
ncbi:hypothetical protein Bca4012_103145 [Brassica carinata]